MAAKRKNPPPPPPQPESSEDDSSSSEDEEKYVARPVVMQPKNPKPTEQDDDESESDSGTESEAEIPVVVPPPPQKPSESEDSSEEEEDDEEEEEKEKKKAEKLPPVVVPSPPQKPSETEDSSEEEEEDEEEKEIEKEKEKGKAEKLKSPVKAPETEPDKKKVKLSEPDQSGSKKTASAANSRIWSQEDEIVLLRALSDYHSKNGKLPPIKNHGSFLLRISGSISFPATEKQLTNKVRTLKDNFTQKKKKGNDVKMTKPHDKAVFEMCSKLFQDDIKTPKKEKEVLPESNSDGTVISGLAGVGEANGAMDNKSPANNGSGNDAAGTKSFVHLRSLLKDMESEWLLTVKDVIACIGESRAKSLEEKTKMLNIDVIKLRARKEKVKAEVLGYLAEGLADE